jgi:hypothetical protein
MADIELDVVREFVNENIDRFHQARLEKIRSLRLKNLLRRKNPYLFRAKNINNAPTLVNALLDAFVSSSEETMFGDFLETLAIFVCQTAYQGQKSSAAGIDLELTRDNVRYLVAIKSSPNWGNSSQYRALRNNFNTAVRILRQAGRVAHVQPVLGMCYGNSPDTDMGDYLKKCGQSFWTFISGSSTLYIDIVEPLGYRAKERDDWYVGERTNTYLRFLNEFVSDFCYPSGHIDWAKLVAFNSGNLANPTDDPS